MLLVGSLGKKKKKNLTKNQMLAPSGGCWHGKMAAALPLSPDLVSRAVYHMSLPLTANQQ